MGFSTERSDALWWLMISGDSNATARCWPCSTSAQWRDDVPRLVRGALGRQQRGHWNTTVANAWGVLALEKFSAAFESTPVTRRVRRFATDAQALRRSCGRWRRNSSDRRRCRGRMDAQTLAVTPRRRRAAVGDDPRDRGAAAQNAACQRLPITRTVTPVEQQDAGHDGRRGDVARVHIDVEAQSDMTWVVVDDPIPAGATHPGQRPRRPVRRSDAGRAGAGLGLARIRRARASTSFRAYYRFVPKGTLRRRVHGAPQQPGHVPIAARRASKRCTRRRCSARRRTSRSRWRRKQ